MLRVKSVASQLKSPCFIIFNDYLKHVTPRYKNDSFAVPLSVVKDEMTIEEINKELSNLNKYVTYEPDLLDTTFTLIENYLKTTSKNPNKLKREILNETYFNREFNNWNLTNFVRKYDVCSREFFLSMVLDAHPYRMGYLANKVKTKENIIKDFNKQKDLDANHIYIDWYNGIGIKNSFPIDHYVSEFELDMRRFNDRNYNTGFHKILYVMEKHLDNNIKVFTKVPNTSDTIKRV